MISTLSVTIGATYFAEMPMHNVYIVQYEKFKFV